MCLWFLLLLFSSRCTLIAISHVAHRLCQTLTQLEIASKIMAPGAQLGCSYWLDFSYLTSTWAINHFAVPNLRRRSLLLVGQLPPTWAQPCTRTLHEPKTQDAYSRCTRALCKCLQRNVVCLVVKCCEPGTLCWCVANRGSALPWAQPVCLTAWRKCNFLQPHKTPTHISIWKHCFNRFEQTIPLYSATACPNYWNPIVEMIWHL